MNTMTRRDALRRGLVGTAGLALTPSITGAARLWQAPGLRRQGPLTFTPHPHRLQPTFDLLYLSDEHGDPFTDIEATQVGIVVPEAMAVRPFAVNLRWFVEGFGHVWLEADNGGRLFTPEDLTGQTFNLNVELARTRIARIAEVIERYRGEGATFSSEVTGLDDLARTLLEDAQQRQGEDAAQRADQALQYALWMGEKMELEKARQDIARMQQRPFHFGCETRQYVWIKSVTMEERFVELFDFATVTHYVYDTWYEVFEPREGVYRWGIKDNIVDWLTENDITIEGRPLLWFHPWVTPEWLAQKDFDSLKQYVENHVEAVVGHYGDRIHHWEVVNEYHDWANIHHHTPEQITEITRLACEKTHEVNPNVSRLINNCCTFAEYAAVGHDAAGEAPRPLRTPRRFVADLIDADVPFEVLGLQMYFPGRSLFDIVRNVERFVDFGKPIYITEIGASSTGEETDAPRALYDWHRPWDEDLQADWLEQIYTIFYSKPYIQAVNWYDFADFRTFIPNGGLIREDGEKKPSYDRLHELLAGWGQLPG